MYNFFNNSYTAFGNNITKVFQSLAKKVDECNIYINILRNKLIDLSRYANKNYQVPQPSSSKSPVPGSLIYDILNVKPMNITFTSNEEFALYVDFKWYDSDRNLITKAVGGTNLNKGICYVYNNSINSVNTPIELKFEEVETPDVLFDFTLYKPGYTLLFAFDRIDSNETITLTHINSLLNIIPSTSNKTAINSVNVERIQSGYISDGYYCIVSSANRQAKSELKVNDITVWSFDGTQNYYPTSRGYTGVYYCKPGDLITISGNAVIYKIEYLVN